MLLPRTVLSPCAIVIGSASMTILFSLVSVVLTCFFFAVVFVSLCSRSSWLVSFAVLHSESGSVKPCSILLGIVATWLLHASGSCLFAAIQFRLADFSSSTIKSVFQIFVFVEDQQFC